MRSRRIAAGVSLDQLLEGADGEQRAVAIEDQQGPVAAGEGLAAGQQRVRGSSLLGLLDKPDAVAGEGGFDFGGLAADHDEDAIRRRHGQRGGDDMLDDGDAAGVVKHLGFLRFHAGAEARGQNDDGDRR